LVPDEKTRWPGRGDRRALTGKGIVGDELEAEIGAAFERPLVATFVDPRPAFTAGARWQPELLGAGTGEAVAADSRCVVEVELEDAAFARTLPPGTSADVEVILDKVDDVLRIPSYALIEGARVLVLREGRLASVDVKTGLKN